MTDLNNIFQSLLEVLRYNPEQPLIFSSGLFFWLFAAFIIVYALLRKASTARLLFVLAFSYYFYYKCSGFYFFLLAVVTVSDFAIAALIGRTASRAARKWLVALSLLIDLGLLGYFKYTNFLGQLLASVNLISFHEMDIFLPVGISFFTFQSLSYIIDVYRGKIKPLTNLLDYAFYVSFFPQLVAGPIVRAADFIPQIRRPLLVTREMLGMGFWFIIIGLFKKAVISDYISLNFIDRVFDAPTLYSGIENLVAIYGYGMQIYCDFSGYSDMAIGLALLMGFKFNINFNSPYKAQSISDFWHRWHISLSTWLRDYLYISLGGNRKGKLRQYLNLFITMLLGGLWHGASLNFVAWGAMHGIGLAIHKMWMGWTAGARWVRSRAWCLFSLLLTFHIVALTWVLFRNHEFADAMAMLNQVATNFHPELLPQLLAGYPYVMMLIALGYVLHFLPDRLEWRAKRTFVKLPIWCYAIALLALIYVIIQVKSSDIQPFIYFQF